ncbi:mucin-4 [Octopus bimaculoides]|uniref:Bromo domain-containing protein n=1 Tax=Octopus bimaculoides TaxID=37653 RepID=A0A0L8HNV5_OCTBM|nr:mucin-4 [Octopus bimaculoides]|eukprot:XP_014770738.1 PREDICTED: serine-rich adhesin for platelets-like [Octopus bimaculoides]
MREYLSLTQFVADFRLMLENCYRYNGPDNYISKRGQRLETMFEQKLALLPRDLREKTTVKATSGHCTPEDIAVVAGLRRRTRAVAPHDSSALLNQLRHEEIAKEKEARKQQIEEKRAAQEAHVQEVNDWEDILLEQPLLSQMKAMWELPQIGHFLFLCQEPLYLAEVPQYELERCFLMTRESTTMQRIMSSLLSTPHQRSKLHNHRYRMPYRVWEEKLRQKVKNWYDVLEAYNGDTYKAAEKLGLDPFAYKVMGKRNPLKNKKYHQLSFYRKVWVMKSICDDILEHQEPLREAIELQAPEEQREYNLGRDAEGNIYIHFPQFCGADLRVYKHIPHPNQFPQNDDDTSTQEPPEEMDSLKEKNKDETAFEEDDDSNLKSRPQKKKRNKAQVSTEIISPPSSRPSRLRQKIKTVLPPTVISSEEEDSDYSFESLHKLGAPLRRGRKKRRTLDWSRNCFLDPWGSPINYLSNYRKNGAYRMPTYLKHLNNLKFNTKDRLSNGASVLTDQCKIKCESKIDCKCLADSNHCKVESEGDSSSNSCHCKHEEQSESNTALSDYKLSNGMVKQESGSHDCQSGVMCCAAEVKSECKPVMGNFCGQEEDDQRIKSVSFIKQEPLYNKVAFKQRPEKLKGKRGPKPFGLKGRSKMDFKKPHVKTKVAQDKLNGDIDSSVKEESEEESDVELVPDTNEFELIVDSVEELRDLVAKFAAQDSSSGSRGRKQKVKPPARKRCVIELHSRLNYLLKELEPWEAKLIQANRRARRKMKREQESFKEEQVRPARKELRNSRSSHGSNSSAGKSTFSERTQTNSTPSSKLRPSTLSKRNRGTLLSSSTSLLPIIDDDYPDVSSRGRLRKRRIIPNNIETDLNPKKRRLSKDNSSDLMRGKKTPNSAKGVKSVDQSTTTSVTNSSSISVATAATISKVSVAGLITQTGVNVSGSEGNTVLTTVAALGKSSGIKQTSYPVIHQLLSSRHNTSYTTAQVSSTPVTIMKTVSSKTITMQPLASNSGTKFITKISHDSGQKLNQQTVNISNNSGTAQGGTAQGGTTQGCTVNKVQYYTHLSSLPPQIIQQLLKNVNSGDGAAGKVGHTFVLSSVNQANNVVLSQKPAATTQPDKTRVNLMANFVTNQPISSTKTSLNSTVETVQSTSSATAPTTVASNVTHNPNIMHTVLQPQFQVLLNPASQSSASKTSVVSLAQNQSKTAVRTHQGPVYVISKPGIASQILGATTKLIANTPVNSAQCLSSPSLKLGNVIDQSYSSHNTPSKAVSSSSSTIQNINPRESKLTNMIIGLDNQTALSQNPLLSQSVALDPHLVTTSKTKLTKSPGKYACNVTVKSLLESRAAKKVNEDVLENALITTESQVTATQMTSVINQPLSTTDATVKLLPALSSSVNDSAHVAKNTCLLSSVQSQQPEVKSNSVPGVTSLSSTVTVMPAVQARKSITHTTQSNKSPITVTPQMIPHSNFDNAKNNNLLSLQSTTIGQAVPAGTNIRVNIPQAALLAQSSLNTLKSATGRSLAILQPATSIANSKNVILKVVPQNILTTTSTNPIGEQSLMAVTNMQTSPLQQTTNLVSSRTLSQSDLKQFAALPQQILTTANPAIPKSVVDQKLADAAKVVCKQPVANVVSGKANPAPVLNVGLQNAAVGVPLSMQGPGGQSILLLSPKDQNLQQQKAIGVIPVQSEQNATEIVKKFTSVQQISSLSTPAIQIIPSQSTNSAVTNLTSLRGQLLQTTQGNIILTTPTISSGSSHPGTISHLLQSSLGKQTVILSGSNNDGQPASYTAATTPNTATTISLPEKSSLRNSLPNVQAVQLKSDSGSNTIPLTLSSNVLRLDGATVAQPHFTTASAGNNLITFGLSPVGLPTNLITNSVGTQLLNDPSSLTTNTSLSSSSSSASSLPTISSSLLTSSSSTSLQQLQLQSQSPQLVSSTLNPQLVSGQQATLAIPTGIRPTLSNPSKLPAASSKPDGFPSAVSPVSDLSRAVQQRPQLVQNVSFVSSNANQLLTTVKNAQVQNIVPAVSRALTNTTRTTDLNNTNNNNNNNNINNSSSSLTSNVLGVTQVTLPTTVPSLGTSTSMVTDISKLSPQVVTNYMRPNSIQTAKTVAQTPVKNRHVILQQKLSSPPTLQQAQKSVVSPQIQQKQTSFVSNQQPQTSNLSNNLLNVNRTSSCSAVGVQQLVLYSIGGQLVTPQGIPVTLENGVLKILTAPPAAATAATATPTVATAAVTSNQIMLVQSPNPSVIGSPTTQAQLRCSTPVANALSKVLKPSQPLPSAAQSFLLSPTSNISPTNSIASSSLSMPTQLTYAVPAQAILPTGTDIHGQYLPKLNSNTTTVVAATTTTTAPPAAITTTTTTTSSNTNNNSNNNALTSITFTPTLTSSLPSMISNPCKIPPSSALIPISDSVSGAKLSAASPNLTDMYLNKISLPVSSDTKSGNTMVIMAANPLQSGGLKATKHSISAQSSCSSSNGQALTAPVQVGNLVSLNSLGRLHFTTTNTLTSPNSKSKGQSGEKEDSSFEGAAILLSLAQQAPTAGQTAAAAAVSFNPQTTNS